MTKWLFEFCDNIRPRNRLSLSRVNISIYLHTIGSSVSVTFKTGFTIVTFGVQKYLHSLANNYFTYRKDVQV